LSGQTFRAGQGRRNNRKTKTIEAVRVSLSTPGRHLSSGEMQKLHAEVLYVLFLRAPNACLDGSSRPFRCNGRRASRI
jgi:hypothetical protein